MAFEKTPGGTRGTNMPSFVAPAMKFMNNQMIRRFRRSAATGGKTTGMDRLVLTTVGAKSGQRRQTLLGTFPDGDSAWLIVASAGGQVKNPAWYHKTLSVTATQLAGQERDAAWQRITAAQPRYAGYEKKTDRVLPVIRLTAS
jgi:F420H(2)-dependent quinone reductase